MQRTYYSRYDRINGEKFDKITYRSPEDRPRWHKVEALEQWKRDHRGYAKLTIRDVFTKAEMKDMGYNF